MSGEDSAAGKITSIILPVLEKAGFELVDLEYKKEGSGWVLRVFIDTAGGVNLDDCAEISRELDAVLDAEDVIPHHYNLEVSSPGLNRPLKKEADFKRFLGKLARVKTFEALDGSRNFKGRIVSCENGMVTVNVDGKDREIPLTKIAKANIEYEF